MQFWLIDNVDDCDMGNLTADRGLKDGLGQVCKRKVVRLALMSGLAFLELLIDALIESLVSPAPGDPTSQRLLVARMRCRSHYPSSSQAAPPNQCPLRRHRKAIRALRVDAYAILLSFSVDSCPSATIWAIFTDE